MRLLKLSTGHAILVVREIAKNPPEVISSSVQITGRLYPRQNVDRAFAKDEQLPRTDPSLVVSKDNPFLYDGYIVLPTERVANSEKNNITPIPSPQLSYVVVWWFMALLLLIAPLFPQFRAPKKNEKVGKVK